MAVDVDESMLLLGDCLVVSDQKVGIKKFTAKEHALTLSHYASIKRKLGIEASEQSKRHAES